MTLMDTGAAAVLGALGDPRSGRGGRHRRRHPRQRRQHAHLRHARARPPSLRTLRATHRRHHADRSLPIWSTVCATRRSTPSDFRDTFDGHGAALTPEYREIGPFRFVAITGPRRRLAHGLGYYEAAPHGDMMLSGSWGLVTGVQLLAEE